MCWTHFTGHRCRSRSRCRPVPPAEAMTSRPPSHQLSHATMQADIQRRNRRAWHVALYSTNREWYRCRQIVGRVDDQTIGRADDQTSRRLDEQTSRRAKGNVPYIVADADSAPGHGDRWDRQMNTMPECKRHNYFLLQPLDLAMQESRKPMKKSPRHQNVRKKSKIMTPRGPEGPSQKLIPRVCNEGISLPGSDDL